MADRDSTPKTRKNAVLPIPCRACGKEFKPRKKTTKFCSRACQFEGQRTAGQWTDCEHCGSRFYARAWQGADGKSLQRYCTKRCADSSIRYSSEQKRIASTVRSEREALARIARRVRRGYRAAFLRRRDAVMQWKCRSCDDCGRAFGTAVRPGRLPTRCSDCCEARKTHARREYRRRARRDGRLAGGSSRARARHYGVPYEPVKPIIVFMRDGWRCQICGKPTPRERRGSRYPNAPQLDHRVPISKGGPHTYENIQCACLRCNEAKSNASEVGQLPLLDSA